MLNKQNRFSIRKLSVGVASVAVAAFLAGAPAQINAQDGTEPAEEVTYKLVVNTADTQITSEYTASSVDVAEKYFRNYVNNNGLGDLEWSSDPATNTFTATDGTEPAEEEENETPVAEVTYKLVVNTADTQITSEYTASSVDVAEKYFRNYVNNNGLGDLEWSYDPATNTFTATDGTEPAAQEYSVTYEYHKLDGTIETLQIENGWTDWAAMEQASVATANIFAKTYGAWDVVANPDGLVYIFTQKADPKPTPDKPGDDNKPGKTVVPSAEAGKATLPETGEASDGVIFSAAALAVLAGVGLVAPSFKKEN